MPDDSDFPMMFFAWGIPLAMLFGILSLFIYVGVSIAEIVIPGLAITTWMGMPWPVAITAYVAIGFILLNIFWLLGLVAVGIAWGICLTVWSAISRVCNAAKRFGEP